MGQRKLSSWTDVASRIPIRVTELAGRELYNAQQVQADITIEVRLRWREGVASTMRLVWHDGSTDRPLAILAPPTNPDGRKRWMHLMCKEQK